MLEHDGTSQDMDLSETKLSTISFFPLECVHLLKISENKCQIIKYLYQ